MEVVAVLIDLPVVAVLDSLLNEIGHRLRQFCLLGVILFEQIENLDLPVPPNKRVEVLVEDCVVLTDVLELDLGGILGLL